MHFDCNNGLFSELEKPPLDYSGQNPVTNIEHRFALIQYKKWEGTSLCSLKHTWVYPTWILNLIGIWSLSVHLQLDMKPLVVVFMPEHNVNVFSFTLEVGDSPQFSDVICYVYSLFISHNICTNNNMYHILSFYCQFPWKENVFKLKVWA